MQFLPLEQSCASSSSDREAGLRDEEPSKTASPFPGPF